MERNIKKRAIQCIGACHSAEHVPNGADGGRDECDDLRDLQLHEDRLGQQVHHPALDERPPGEDPRGYDEHRHQVRDDCQRLPYARPRWKLR